VERAESHNGAGEVGAELAKMAGKQPQGSPSQGLVKALGPKRHR
jgi:hypothetical protein